jgi:hypothetical protein
VGDIQIPVLLAGASFAAGLTVNPNGSFQFNMPGAYLVDAKLQTASPDQAKQYKLTLYDNTLGAEAASVIGSAFYTGLSVFLGFNFGFQVADPTHVYSFRIVCLGAGSRIAMFSILSFAALVSSFAPQADGVTIIQNADGTITANASALTLPGIFPVDFYGAKGDGVTNDTIAINAAIAAAVANGGGVVWFNAKTYLTNALTMPSGVQFSGAEGQVSTLLRAPGALAGTALLSASGAGQVVRWLTLDGNNLNTNGMGVYLNGCSKVLMQNVNATNCTPAFYLFNSSSCEAYNCVSNTTPGNAFAEGGGCSKNRYTNCDAIAAGTLTIPGAGFTLNASTGTRLVNCSAVNCFGDGFYISNSSDVHGVNCKAERNAGNGFGFNGTTDCHFSNIYAHWNSSSDNVGTGRNTYDGVHVEGATSDLLVTGRSGDRADASLLNTPYQRYGVFEDPTGAYTRCSYQLDLGLNATGPSSLVGGNLIPFQVDGTSITINPSGVISSTGGAYTNPVPTPVTLGGIPAGSTFVAQTMTQMWTALLYPYQYPAFTSFLIQGQSNPLEVGDSIPAAVTFRWTDINPANIVANSINITDVTLSIVLAAGLPDTGSDALNMPGPVQRTTAGTHVFGIDATNTHAGTFSDTATYEWRWRAFWGNSANTTLTEPQIKALASNALLTRYPGSYAMAAGGYKYICQSDALGGQINTVKDSMTLLNVPMATVVDDPAYSNVDGGGFYYDLVSITNAFGVVNNYRVYRTQNSLGGAITLLVT